jgi:hypothetical protein
MRDQHGIEVQDHFVVLDIQARDLGARYVVLGADGADGRERGRLAVRDVALGDLARQLVLLNERGQNFTRVLLEEQRLVITSVLDLREVEYPAICA